MSTTGDIELRAARTAPPRERDADSAARDRAAASRRSGKRTGGGVRRDIQGLRAIAVALVLVYHLSPAALPGGYVGVDVFFVISGFLITGQLLREAEGSGRIDLPRFWARRARRLLPAALVVLAVTLVAVWVLSPRGFLPSFLVQVAASAGYAQNWVLAGQSVDYMASEAQASPVQHYWSLSVEEQFYIVWPLVAALAALIAAKLASRASQRTATSSGTAFRTLFAVSVALIAAVSLALSIGMTATDPARAYFVTTTRAWEFAAGGLLAWLASAPSAPLERMPAPLRAAMAWIGLTGIAAAAFLYTDATPFPGWAAALPVVATALVIAASEPSFASARLRLAAPQPLLAARPMQWLGDASYGIYLWHFPLIVLAPFALGRGLDLGGALAVTVLTLLLAAASKRWIEDPFRTGVSRGWPNGRTLVLTTAAMAAVLGFALAGVHAADQQVAAERARVAAELRDPEPCMGATALEEGSGCEPLPERVPIPEPALADKSPERCLSETDEDGLLVCEYGADADEAVRTVALIGDSHAEQWLVPLREVAERQGWRLVVMARASCPFTSAERDFVSSPDAENERLSAACGDWNDEVRDRIEQDPEIDTVITSAKSGTRFIPAPGEQEHETARKGYERSWTELPDSVERVIAIRDTPQLSDDVLQCVTQEGALAAEKCAVPKSTGMGADPLADAADATGSTDGKADRTALVDMSDYFVVGSETPPVIGGVLAFRDSHHLSWAYAEMLADPLAERIKAALGEHTAA